MAIKTILVALNEVSLNDQIIAVSAELGRKFDAHVTGLYVIPAAEIYPVIGESLSTQVYAGHREFYLDQADKVKEEFEGEMKRQGIKNEWRKIDVRSSLIADGLMPHAFQADLIVVPQKPERVDLDDESLIVENDFTERVIMESGRPVLVIPASGKFSNIGENILVGWNGTRESARSAFYAIPFMRDAKNVTITWVNPEKDLPEKENLPGTEMAASLARHDIKARVKAVTTSDLSTGEALLSNASIADADLLVIGTYGHSRLREFILGGVTRTILNKMTIPVLMSH